MQLLMRGIRSIYQKGLARTTQSVISIAEDAWFDRKFGLETAEIVHVQNLDIGADDKQHSVQYQPTRVRHFRKLMRALKLPTSHVFVDVGCGKGRILIAAAQYGFRHVEGIEISPQLTEVARRNIDIYHRGTGQQANIEVTCSNVLDFNLKRDENVFYLYWPFDRVVMTQFLEKLRSSFRACPREIWLIVNDFQFHDLLDGDQDFDHRDRLIYGGGEFDIYRTTT